MISSLYVSRPLLNGDEFLAWAKSIGFEKCVPSEELHVTIMYSKKEVDWSYWEPEKKNLRIKGGIRRIEFFGEAKNCAVLKFESGKLFQRHKAFLEGGCSFDYNVYKPHVTLTYNYTQDLKHLPPFEDDLVFGPEKFAKIDEDYLSKVTEK